MTIDNKKKARNLKNEADAWLEEGKTEFEI